MSALNVSTNNRSKRAEVRLEKARVLQAHVATLDDLQKSQPEAISIMAKSFKECNELYLANALAEKDKSVSVYDRYISYQEDEMKTVLSGINKYLVANRLKVDEPTRKQVSKYIALIRGNVPSGGIPKEPTNPLLPKTEKNKNTQHIYSYGNKLMYFRSILKILESLGEAYSPGLKVLQYKYLDGFYKKLERSHNAISTTSSVMTSTKELLSSECKYMMDRCLDVKNHIAAQYSIHSDAYKKISGIYFI